MIIVLRSGATEAQVSDVCHRITAMGYSPHTIRGALRTVIGAVGDDRGKDALCSLDSLECVESVTPILKPYKLASREMHRDDTESEAAATCDRAGTRSRSSPGRARSRTRR